MEISSSRKNNGRTAVVPLSVSILFLFKRALLIIYIMEAVIAPIFNYHTSNRPHYQDISSQRSQFSSSFDDGCNNCTLAILSARDNLLNQFNVNENGIEKSVCLIAIIISMTAGMIEDFSTINDFYGCLLWLDQHYICSIFIKRKIHEEFPPCQDIDILPYFGSSYLINLSVDHADIAYHADNIYNQES
ncbi:unnamed protein product [Fraxinus pennsylvanica]|uniref:Uncharacterized protein n=1 Tax=Fraxinus pennsylvanica TaxID=56036 RepID=A0AAD1ZPZ4_9LAMI|nr:unnamed protein product [Fraxinus pennsylvanica]